MGLTVYLYNLLSIWVYETISFKLFATLCAEGATFFTSNWPYTIIYFVRFDLQVDICKGEKKVITYTQDPPVWLEWLEWCWYRTNYR